MSKINRVMVPGIAALAAILTLGLTGTATAFHGGGVAHCDGCHTMHNSQDGKSIIDGGTVGTTGAHLTIGADPGSTCLNSHAGTGTYVTVTILEREV